MDYPGNPAGAGRQYTAVFASRMAESLPWTIHAAVYAIRYVSRPAIPQTAELGVRLLNWQDEQRKDAVAAKPVEVSRPQN